MTNQSQIKLIISEFIFFLVLGTIIFILDVYTLHNKLYSKCEEKQHTMTVLYIHHLIAVFFQFGWLANSILLLKLHIYSIIIMLLAQASYSGKCPLTLYVNQRCNVTEHYYLRDIMHHTNMKSAIEYFSIVILVSGISYYKLKLQNVNLFDCKFW